jgi:CRP/FNR family cyclic AMP-dependent transcriptional regulator
MARIGARRFLRCAAGVILKIRTGNGGAMKIADLLDGLDLVQDFSYPELETMAGYMTLDEVPKGRTIFEEGDLGDFMLVVVDGRIGIYKGGEHGRQLLSSEMKGRIIGEMAMIDHERRSATCIAETDCMLLILTSTNLKSLALAHPMLAYHLMASLARILSRRLRRASGMMADFLDR